MALAGEDIGVTDTEKTSATPDLQTTESQLERAASPLAAKDSAFKSLGWLDRFLAVWIFAAMVLGILLGNFVPQTEDALEKGTFVGVSTPIAVGLLVMMYPILCKVKFETFHLILTERKIWMQILFSIVVNWLVAPFLVLGLAWAFLPDETGLREGLIMVGLARCIAMVLIWTGLAGGDNEYCAILVTINSILQMIFFAPLGILFLEVISDADDEVTYSLVAKSVGVFLGIPLGAALVTRVALRQLAGPSWYDAVFLRFLSPWSLIGLLYTIVVLFANQGKEVVHQVVSVCRVAAPLIVYFAIAFFGTLFIAYRLGFGYRLAATQSFTAASNNFELAIAVAIATYGPGSDQALAATVGPLIEVPVLISFVYIVKALANRMGWKD